MSAPRKYRLVLNNAPKALCLSRDLGKVARASPLRWTGSTTSLVRALKALPG